MIIKRFVNGIEMSIELTPAELYEAYLEKQSEFDVEDVGLYYDGVFDSDEELKIAKRSRVIQDKYGMNGREALDEAIRDLDLWDKVENNVSSMEAEILNTIKVNVAF